MDKKKCFVIMPFSQTTEKHNETYWTELFEIIKRIMEENNYDCVRSEAGPYKLFTNIVNNIDESDFVVAVLTDFNVNVWYELGIRHTLKNGTLMLLEEGNKIPFDINDFGVVFYKDSIGLENYLKRKIKSYLNILHQGSCDSPVIFSLKNRKYDNIEEKICNLEKILWGIVKQKSGVQIHRDNFNNRQYKVLWVDDYPINNEMIRTFFYEMHVSFDLAVTTNQAINCFDSNEYDLIITDMGRKNENDHAGNILIKKLRELNCKVPIVVYTSERAIQKFGNEAINLGAYEVTSGIENIISIITKILKL